MDDKNRVEEVREGTAAEENIEESAQKGLKGLGTRLKGYGQRAMAALRAQPVEPQTPPPDSGPIGREEALKRLLAAQERAAATEEPAAVEVFAPGGPQGGGDRPPRKGKQKKQLEHASGGRVFGRMVLNMFKVGFVALCMVVLAVCVVAVGLVNYVVAATEGDEEALQLETRQYTQTSFIYYEDTQTGEWVELQELISASEHRIWVDLCDVPQDLIDAVVATEDREFYEHGGVSLTRTAYAFLNEIFEMRSTFGASTIDQQVVKNLTNDDGVDYLRKLREMYRAWGLNSRYSKDMIMEAYLNSIGLSERIVGVQAGANMYFNKDVSELNLWECATIAGITQAPTYYSPVQNPDNALTRRNNVLFFMFECEYITEEEYEHAVAQPLGLDLTQNEQVSESVFSYFADQVFNDVLADLIAQKGMTYSEAYNYIYTGGLRIYSTMDYDLQTAMEELYAHAYDEDGYLTEFKNQKTGRAYKTDLTYTVKVKDEDGAVVDTYEMLPQSAAVSVRYDGSLAAVVGGIGEKETSLSLNRATQSTRQVGSTIKPIAAYALGIDQGYINWGSMVPDSPSRYTNPNKTSGSHDWPKNATMSYRNSNVPIVTAVAESINTVAVRVGTFVGIGEMYSFLVDKLGITSLHEADQDIAPLALGALTEGISPYEMAAAYTIFGGEDSYGVYTTPHSYYFVEDSRGVMVLSPDTKQTQAVSEETGFIMNRLLAGVFGDNTLPGNGAPTAKGMKPEGGMDAVAKTGTTNNDSDRWFVGLTPYYVTAIWWGYDINPENPEDNPIYKYWTRSSTGNVPSNLWKTLMEEGQANLDHKEFPDMPANVEERSYCTITGLGAHYGCPTATGYFAVDDPLMDTCRGHRSAAATEGEQLASGEG